ncbi:uncharacterized protein [Rutidosis leptorrhynchoides]|uniref:uncharacterized protein n=1 Tax=Rutidosis leptorrhynchoides TaxID=125765 RepID=UPI003A9942E9
MNAIKTTLYGIHVSREDMLAFSAIFKCKVGVFPLEYLGIPIGLNRDRISMWKPIIQKFKSKLAGWKGRCLSFGGRLVMVNAVISNLPIHYMSIYKVPISVIKTGNFRVLSTQQSESIEAPFSEAEVRKAVWDCGDDKAPGPDGFSIRFIKHFWDLLKEDVIKFVNCFHASGYIPNGCNSSFFTMLPKVDSPLLVKDYRPISLIGIQYKILAKILASRLSLVIDSVISNNQSAFVKGRQILDGPLIINELVDWCKRKKKQAMLLKVDFEKAFDSISWEYLISMLGFLGFGKRWILWIKGCLMSSRASVLVNGSPSEEFHIGRGLRQGDPLSPFLFIICMEGLHAAIMDSMHLNFFKGVQVGCGPNAQVVSHCFFADDALFVGEWNDGNAQNLLCILRCFQLVSGLRINMIKSNLLGVGINGVEVDRLAGNLGCRPDKLPFTFLGLPVGKNMNRIDSWDPILNKFKSKLATWKVNLLSFGGRLTLIKSVLGALGTYYFSMFKAPKGVLKSFESIRAKFFWGCSNDTKKVQWVKWSDVCRGKDKGGLGVIPLKNLNNSLLYKWRWRYLTCKNWLWSKVVRAIHGSSPDVVTLPSSISGKWSCITRVIGNIHATVPAAISSISVHIGNGCNTLFWHERWLNGHLLCDIYPRLYALETQQNCSIQDCRVSDDWIWHWRREIRSGVEDQQLQAILGELSSVVFTNHEVKWVCNVSSDGSFSVHGFRSLLYNDAVHPFPTEWFNFIPPKVNIFLWRSRLGRLPDKCSLLERGISSYSMIMCSSCNQHVEDMPHIFFECDTAVQVWQCIAGWLGFDLPRWQDMVAFWQWVLNCSQDNKKKMVIQSICFSTLWALWRFRNAVIFDPAKFRKCYVVDSIIFSTFDWLSNRYKKAKIHWNSWLQNPVMTL